MTAAVFVDSNLFLYAMDEGDKSKQEAARNWRSALWTSRLGRLSVQVLGEFYVNAMRLRPVMRRAPRSSLCWRGIRWWPTRLYRSVDGSFKIAIGSLTGTL